MEEGRDALAAPLSAEKSTCVGTTPRPMDGEVRVCACDRKSGVHGGPSSSAPSQSLSVFAFGRTAPIRRQHTHVTMHLHALAQ